MRNDERLRTIYEVMAPYIVRNEHNWRDYLAFASQFHKHSFDTVSYTHLDVYKRQVWGVVMTMPGWKVFLQH